MNLFFRKCRYIIFLVSSSLRKSILNMGFVFSFWNGAGTLFPLFLISDSRSLNFHYCWNVSFLLSHCLHCLHILYFWRRWHTKWHTIFKLWLIKKNRIILKKFPYFLTCYTLPLSAAINQCQYCWLLFLQDQSYHFWDLHMIIVHTYAGQGVFNVLWGRSLNNCQIHKLELNS